MSECNIHLPLCLHHVVILRLDVPVVAYLRMGGIYLISKPCGCHLFFFFCQRRDVEDAGSVTGTETPKQNRITRTTNHCARSNAGLQGLNGLAPGLRYSVLGLEPDHWDYSWVSETAGRSL